MRKTITGYISGRVQGVMYRQSIKDFAEANNIFGFVENLSDGRVKVVGVGTEESLRKLLQFCETGSQFSKPETISYSWGEDNQTFSDFEIKRSGRNILTDQYNAISNLGKSFFTNEKKMKVEISLYPKHLAIIPDGNRRWAKDRGLATILGHQAGKERFKEVLRYLQRTPVATVTFWAFSTENWKREESEVKYLMESLSKTIKEIRIECVENKIVFRHLGRKTELSDELVEALNNLEKETNKFLSEKNVRRLNIAIDYGGRDEIVRAVNKIPDGETIDEKTFDKYLDTFGIPDPDLIIRTSGEMRLSGILPWQSTYAELYFTQKHFPDFDSAELELALADFSSRKRRFGA